MQLSFAFISLLLTLAAAAPHNRNVADISNSVSTASTQNNAATGTDTTATTGAKAASGADGASIISQLQGTFDRNNPNGTPTVAGDPDDLNGDGVINVFEAGAQAS